MSMTQIFLLAIIQGVTEFLPVSSSGHLNLLHGLTDLPDQGIIIDVAVHAGTLLAVMIYFRHDVIRLLHGGIEILSPQSTKKPSENKSAAIQIIIATLPILPVGALLVTSGSGSCPYGPVSLLLLNMHQSVRPLRCSHVAPESGPNFPVCPNE